MGLVAPEEGHVWWTCPLQDGQEVVVCGELHSWFTHWYRGPLCRGSIAVRCVREERGDCDWCTAQYERRVRYVFPILVEGDCRVVELGRVQYPSLCSIMAFHDWVGARLWLVRERPQKNAPIKVRRVGQEIIRPDQLVDLTTFVQGLGLSNLRMLDNQGALGDAPPLGLDGLGKKSARR